MAINLLPSEKKSKVDKQKHRVAPRIEMMSATDTTVKKSGPQKTGGVLMFVKDSFRRPKKDLTKEKKLKTGQKRTAQKMPRKKILLTEKIVYEKEKVKPKVEYIAPKAVSEKKKKQLKKEGSLFSRLFGKKKIKPVHREEIHAITTEKEAFPKYKSVHAEKIIPQSKSKKVRNGDVVVVMKKEEKQDQHDAVAERTHKKYRGVTSEGFPDVEAFKATLETATKKQASDKATPKKKKPSAWSRFVTWWKKTFSKKKKALMVPPKTVIPAKPSEPLQDEFFVARKKTIIPKKEAPNQKPVEAKKEPPGETVRKDTFVYTQKEEIPLTPPKPIFEKSEEPIKHVPQHPEIKVEPEKRVPVPPAPPPSPQEAPAVKEVQKEKAPKEKGAGFGVWWKKILDAIKKIFTKKDTKKIQKPIPDTKPPEVKQPVMPLPPKPPVGQPVHKALEADQHEKTAPIMPPLPPDARGLEKTPELSEIETPPHPDFLSKEEKKEELHKATAEKKHVEVPEAHEKESGIDMTQPEEIQEKSGGFDWEVNLVPEEMMEQEVPVSKFLYLILFVIIACGVVFGGWLGVSWYYTNIASKISEVEGKIESKQSEINIHERLQDEVRQLNSSVRDVNTLLSQHVYWAQIFTKLEQYTIPEVYFTGMTADVNGSIKLTAVGKDYESAIKQLLVYEEATDFVASATISQILYPDQNAAATDSEAITSSVASEQVSFIVDLSIHPTIFYYNQQ